MHNWVVKRCHPEVTKGLDEGKILHKLRMTRVREIVAIMEDGNLTRRAFEDWEARAYFASTSPGTRWTQRLMDELFAGIDVGGVGSILDVGCGTGEKTFFLRSRFTGAHALGVDFSQSGVDIASANYEAVSGLEFKCFEADDESLWAQKYDLISCFETLEHIDDWQSVVDKFAASSSKYILLSFPTGRMRKFEATTVGHVRNFKKNEVETYLARHGFSPVGVFYAGFPFFNPIGRDLAQLFSGFRNDKIIKASEPSSITKLYSSVVYVLLRYFSTKRRFGNQFLGLFSRG